MNIIKKNIFLVTIILLSIIAFSFYKGDERDNMIKTLQDKPLKQIEILKTGNPVVKKVVTSDEDMKNIISFIKDIEFRKKVNIQPKGWAYSLSIITDNGNEYSVSILGGLISIDNTFYEVDDTVSNEFASLYNSLDYKAVGPFD